MSAQGYYGGQQQGGPPPQGGYVSFLQFSISRFGCICSPSSFLNLPIHSTHLNKAAVTLNKAVDTPSKGEDTLSKGEDILSKDMAVLHLCSNNVRIYLSSMHQTSIMLILSVDSLPLRIWRSADVWSSTEASFG